MHCRRSVQGVLSEVVCCDSVLAAAQCLIPGGRHDMPHEHSRHGKRCGSSDPTVRFPGKTMYAKCQPMEDSVLRGVESRKDQGINAGV